MINRYELGLKVSWQLHSHEDPSCKERHKNADEPNGRQHNSVEFGRGGVVRPVQDDEAEAPHGEEEAGGQALHDVLAVDSVGHEGHGTGVTVLVSC